MAKLTQHGFIMTAISELDKPGKYFLEIPGYDKDDRARCKTMLSSISIAAKRFGLVLVSRSLTRGIGVFVRVVDSHVRDKALKSYKPWVATPDREAYREVHSKAALRQKLKRHFEGKNDVNQKD